MLRAAYAFLPRLYSTGNEICTEREENAGKTSPKTDNTIVRRLLLPQRPTATNLLYEVLLVVFFYLARSLRSIITSYSAWPWPGPTWPGSPGLRSPNSGKDATVAALLGLPYRALFVTLAFVLERKRTILCYYSVLSGTVAFVTED